jgi:hypothetical protein
MSKPDPGRRLEWAGWLTLAALLLLLVPLFLCMPLTADAAFYSVCARHILRGGALAKDFLFLPPPGMAWAMAGARAVLGESPVALRLADLLIFAGIVLLLTRWLAALGLSRAAQVWSAVPMAAFYLSTTELCHCQPDMWMFLPALCALHLRQHRIADPQVGPGWAVLEGAFWGAGCLFKPFVVLPGLLAWLVGAAVLRRSGPGWPRRLLADAGGLLAGGLLAGGAWQLWLVSSGSWSIYWHNVRDVGGDFYAESWPWPARCRFLFIDLVPWGFLHALTLPVALGAVGMVLVRAVRTRLAPPDARAIGFALLSALYLGWMVQSNFIQTQFNYHLVPNVLMALTLTAGLLGQRASLRWGWVGLMIFSAGALAFQPVCRPQRLAAWIRCWREGGSPGLRDELTLDRTVEFAVDSEDLERVADYLRSRKVGEGELLAFNLSTIHLYLQLDVDPPTRYLIPQTFAKFFPKHRAMILAEVRASGARYVVTDLMGVRLTHDQAVAERPDLPPGVAREWPYEEPIVFRAGRYYVHEVR